MIAAAVGAGGFCVRRFLAGSGLLIPCTFDALGISGTPGLEVSEELASVALCGSGFRFLCFHPNPDAVDGFQLVEDFGPFLDGE